MRWTAEETDRARQMLAAGADNATFVKELGRTKYDAKARMKTAKYQSQGIPRPRNCADPHSRIAGRLVVPQELLEEAARRSSAPKSITASFFGDPPQGYSALDRKSA